MAPEPASALRVVADPRGSSECRQVPGPASPGIEAAQNALRPGLAARTLLSIAEMDCPTEERLIRGRLAKVAGLHGMEFNLVQRTLALTHEPEALPRLVAAIRECGVEVEMPGLRGLPPSTELARAGVARTAAGGRVSVRTLLSIAEMDCPTEEGLIRGKLTGMPGLLDMEFNLIQRTLALTHEPDGLPELLEAVRACGFEASQSCATEVAQSKKPRGAIPWRLAVAGLAAVSAELVEWMAGVNELVGLALAVTAIVIGGLSTYKKGWIALKNRNLNMNALMSIAVTGAMLIGEWPEAAMVMFLFSIAELLEAHAVDRARDALGGLLEMTPETAVIRQSGGGWVEMPTSQVSSGAFARVGPGKRIPLDGEVVEGRSTIDQAPITGESVPVDKEPGNPVYAGTINGAGELEIRVTAPAAESTLARIIRTVEAAQASRAPTQRFVDHFARVYTPAVFALALAVAVVPPLVTAGEWLTWVYRALVLLVVACPCALVISTPVTIVSGLTAAARRGILIKGGAHLELGRRLRWLALDKTGTLTVGRPTLTSFEPLPPADEDEIRLLAVSLAVRSDHPVSRAVAGPDAAAARVEPLEVADFTALTGRGVRGVIRGRQLHLGSVRLARELGADCSAIEPRMAGLEAEGKTCVLLLEGARILAVFGVADAVRPSARAAVAELHRLGLRTLMLSGDNPRAAQSIAREVGITEVRAQLLPEQKLEAVMALQVAGDRVGMVGDGVNDAPALAAADLGFAMGAAGTDTAIETADVALMDDDLNKLPAFIRLSRRTTGILAQNIAVALGIKAVFLVLSVVGLASMWMAVFADLGATLIVTFNGLRVLRG